MLTLENRVREWLLQSDRLAAAEPLVSPFRWRLLGRAGDWLWGEIDTGSEFTFQTAVHTTEDQAFCDCPFKQTPCKHQLALLLLFAREPQHFVEQAQIQWLALKTNKNAFSGKRNFDTLSPKVNEDRLKAMQLGAVLLLQFIEDVLRTGLLSLLQQPEKLDHLKARLSDQKFSGPVAAIRNWQMGQFQDTTLAATTLLRQFGEWLPLCKALQHYHDLSPEVQAEVLQLSGVNIQKDQVRQFATPIADYWVLVYFKLHKAIDYEPFQQQEQVFYGVETGQFARVIDFLPTNPPNVQKKPVGSAISGTAQHYPGISPLRALLENPTDLSIVPVAWTPLHVYRDWSTLQTFWQQMVGKNPFQPQSYVWVEAQLLESNKVLQLVDAQHVAFAIQLNNDSPVLRASLAAAGLQCYCLFFSNDAPIVLARFVEGRVYGLVE